MLATTVLGNMDKAGTGGKAVDFVDIPWYELRRGVLRKTTCAGKEIGIRLDEEMRHHDILYEDAECVVVVNVPECDAIIVRPGSMDEMGRACYEIGNKHSPCMIHDGEVIMPYEEPLMLLLERKGFHPVRCEKRLAAGAEHSGHSH